ncbi:MAG: D-tyrosyl-tRNA(Tyr) deacylase [Flavobacteriales bacterium]|jgi:D-aminoacyl-tRNA deacylase|nr:D-tyrosyl-tRNA(Tyr) deacylase [Flavobacteriales bacterium]NCG30405.1 D-tyrosyl-tRNA(Tyr) deacylase [Bacteroidota bacterium]MBT3962918.1 D-tyrosyl-tRNA(Tyr) deacylase [Flavobacteriales bacterium]MBT4705268.1 D-tyrosyl-tRNA(Tyr) deacylase [Flavobacteriales bacterium]MBT4930906.1 D-tyrosyl-tRNA(Tyr) deacylase [Flavobacteriales bacterium]
MRAVIQRVSNASVEVESNQISSIGLGFLVLLGIEEADEKQDAEWLSSKIAALRVFADEEGLMNKSIIDVGGEVLVVSQFTLHASYKKGTRPSFIKAARPEKANPLYEYVCESLESILEKPTLKGVFGAYMDVNLVNDGPVTIIIDTKNKE